MGLLLDGTYHMNHIKKGSAHILQGIVNTFDDYEKALKNTLLNKSAIESSLFMAKHKIKTKYTSKQQTNYREEDEIINKP